MFLGCIQGRWHVSCLIVTLWLISLAFLEVLAFRLLFKRGRKKGAAPQSPTRLGQRLRTSYQISWVTTTSFDLQWIWYWFVGWERSQQLSCLTVGMATLSRPETVTPGFWLLAFHREETTQWMTSNRILQLKAFAVPWNFSNWVN